MRLPRHSTCVVDEDRSAQAGNGLLRRTAQSEEPDNEGMTDPGEVQTVCGSGAFWDDLARDLADPEFERAYAAESRRIAEFDAASNADK